MLCTTMSTIRHRLFNVVLAGCLGLLAIWTLLNWGIHGHSATAAPLLSSAGPMSGATPLGAGTIYTVAYTSSVDGAVLYYHEYVPGGYNSAAPNKLAVLLPGSGGNINQYDRDNPFTWTVQADLRGYILATVQPRTLPGYPAYRFTFYMNSALAPGEQDVLDAINSERSRRLIDPGRIYIGGYSMGGFGALNLAALHPDLFAAAAPGAPMSDLFQQWDYAPSAPAPNFATLFGGVYGQSAITDTYWYQNSPRFLLPNLMNTPIQFLHGVSDTFIPNAASVWPYMQSRHIVDTPGFSDSRGQALTLQDLRAIWPGGYVEEHSWPSTDHGAGSLFWNPADVLAFFDAHVLVTNPISVSFATYDDRHTRAYWLGLNLIEPWTAVAGQVYAIRDPGDNSVQLLVTGSMTITLEMIPMGLESTRPLTMVVRPLDSVPPIGNVALVLSGAWPVGWGYTALKDGTALAPDAYSVQANRFTLLSQPADMTHTYTILAPSFATRIRLPLIQR